jgi:2-polyprenyl-6-methoxyphenol hydroxylase-like FAD-dependent oxidoreductase
MRLAGARRVEALRGTADLPAVVRVPWGPGWALVGDAGWRLDPITGQGIGDALRDADLLATAVLRGLSGAQPLPDALADYHATRDRAGMPLYQFTCDRARLAPPAPPMQQLFGALQHSQPDMDRFAGVAAGITSLSEFFAPENVGRIIGQSTARAA